MTKRRLLLWIAIGVPVLFIIVSASVAFIVMRTLETTAATEASAAAAFEQVRKQYPPDRPPLIQVVDIRRRDVRVNRMPNAPRKPVPTLYFMVWDKDEGKIIRGSAPSWITKMRVSITGIGDWSFSDLHVTLEDIERYAPGIILDFTTPDGQRVLLWA
jgi:hypothetical protein